MCLKSGETRKDLKVRSRRRKRDREGEYVLEARREKVVTTTTTKKAKKKSNSLKKHGADGPSGGVEALLPSLIGLAILGFGLMAKMGFRGRASVAGIDLGTTNSVICVQAPAKGVGEIDCIPDPLTNSSIIPSVVSFLELSERPRGKKEPSTLEPHPSNVIVGQKAKQRIETHPAQTFYHAKRVLGRQSDESAVRELQGEVEFSVKPTEDGPVFELSHDGSLLSIAPQQVGAYVVNHLVDVTKQFLGHDNINSAVIAVPAKFNAQQRIKTAEAFKMAGITVTRTLEEPVAAALAYGLHKKPGVDHILVYDFGGGTLDVSLLHVTDGFVDVLGSDGDDELGGADFDAAISHHLLSTHRPVVDAVTTALNGLEGQTEEQFSTTCPALKSTPLCSLSSFHTIGEKLKIELSSFQGKDGVAQRTCMTAKPATYASHEELCAALQPVELQLTMEDFNSVVQPLYQRSVLPVTRLLYDLGLHRDEIDEVVMVGGTTRMPQIRELVKEAMGVESLNTHIDPDITVAYGAASVVD